MADSYKIHTGLWVAEDGSYGSGEVLIVNTDGWTDEQWASWENATNSDEPSIEDAIAIADGKVVKACCESCDDDLTTETECTNVDGYCNECCECTEHTDGED